jgi:hypothetical protein
MSRGLGIWLVDSNNEARGGFNGCLHKGSYTILTYFVSICFHLSTNAVPRFRLNQHIKHLYKLIKNAHSGGALSRASLRPPSDGHDYTSFMGHAVIGPSAYSSPFFADDLCLFDSNHRVGKDTF